MPDPPTDPSLSTPTLAPTLRRAWAAVCGGVALPVGVLGALAVTTADPPLGRHAEGAFYVVALLSTAGLAAGFALVLRMERRLAGGVGTDAEAAQALRQHAVPALALVGTTALVAAMGSALTGDLLALAFVVPFAAFAVLLWPSDRRVGRWLSLRER